MLVFFYDASFEGLLSAVFDAYTLRTFPDRLLQPGEAPPLFTVGTHSVETRPEKWNRVFKALEKKLSPYAFSGLLYAGLSEQQGSHELLFRYIRKMLDASRSREMDLADADVRGITRLARKVGAEKQHMLGFARFQETVEGIYFAAVSPRYNIVPLMLRHFRDRFGDQQWILYDVGRQYGIFFDLAGFKEVYLEKEDLPDGNLSPALLTGKERLLQTLWKNYWTAASVKERANPKLQRRFLPERFWKYLTEKQ